MDDAATPERLPTHHHADQAPSSTAGLQPSMTLCVLGLRGMPNVMGGIETHAEQLYPKLARLEPNWRIVVLGRTPYVGRTTFAHAGCTIRPVFTVRQKILETSLNSLLGVFVARFAERADVLHVHAIGPALFVPLAKALGMKVVATHHGRDYDRQKWGAVARFMLRWGERVMLRFANQVICVSRADAENLRAAHPRAAAKIAHVPNGITAEAVHAEPDRLLAELGVTPRNYILLVGRLVPEKGFDYALRAAAAMASPLQVVVVGAADHHSRYSAELQQRAGDRVVFAGQRRRDELFALYRNCALFVLPSFHEGHPIVALEAIASGCPVLLSDIRANLDIELPPAHYFPVGDVEALAVRLRAAPFDALRVADPAFRDRYDWGRIAAETATVLTRAAPSGSIGPKPGQP